MTLSKPDHLPKTSSPKLSHCVSGLPHMDLRGHNSVCSTRVDWCGHMATECKSQVSASTVEPSTGARGQYYEVLTATLWHLVRSTWEHSHPWPCRLSWLGWDSGGAWGLPPNSLETELFLECLYGHTTRPVQQRMFLGKQFFLFIIFCKVQGEVWTCPSSSITSPLF